MEDGTDFIIGWSRICCVITSIAREQSHELVDANNGLIAESDARMLRCRERLQMPIRAVRRPPPAR